MHLLHRLFNSFHFFIEVKDTLLLFLSACDWVCPDRATADILANTLKHLAFYEKSKVKISQGNLCKVFDTYWNGTNH